MRNNLDNARNAPPLLDEDILMALHLRDRRGKTYKEIGLKIGRSTAAIAGMLNRVDRQVAKTDQDGNKNGTMRQLWWQDRKAHT